MLFTAAVTDTTAMLTCPCDLADSLTVGATSDTAGAQLDFIVRFTDQAGNLVGTTAPVTLVCGSVKDWPVLTAATVYSGVPQIDGGPAIHACGVTAFVDVVALRLPTGVTTAAKWTLSAHVRFPAGTTKPQ